MIPYIAVSNGKMLNRFKIVLLEMVTYFYSCKNEPHSNDLVIIHEEIIREKNVLKGKILAKDVANFC